MKGTHNENRRISFKAKLARLDIVGTILFLGTICCLILALQWGGQTLPWRSSQVIGLCVGSGLLAMVFGFVQWKRGDNALVPLRILKQRSILVGSSFLFFFGMLNYVVSRNLPPLFPLSEIACLTQVLHSTLSSSRSISKLSKAFQQRRAAFKSFHLYFLRSYS